MLQRKWVSHVDRFPLAQIGSRYDRCHELTGFTMGADHFDAFESAAAHGREAINLRAGRKFPCSPGIFGIIDDDGGHQAPHAF